MVRDIMIVGAGGWGREAAWTLERINAREMTWNILGFADDDPAKATGSVEGYPLLGNVEKASHDHPGAAVYYFSTKAQHKHTDVTYPDEVYLMFGKESAGLPEELLLQHAANTVRIPMRDTLRSLNLSNAAAIAVYEVLRQQDFAGLREDGALTKYDWSSADE